MNITSTILLGEIMASKLGSVDPSAFPDEDFDLYSIPAFDAGQPETRPGSDIGSSKQIIQPGDVLLSKIVPHIRRSWVVGKNRGLRIIGSGEWIVFRNPRIHPGYLRHVLVGDLFHREFMLTVSGVGGSLLRARPAYVAQIRIPLPPLPEQRRIAAILDQAEALRAKRRAALAKLDTLAQSIFIEMFGDPSMNPKGWPGVAMTSLFQVSPIFGTMIPPAVDGGEWLSLRVANIQDWQLDLSDRKYVQLPNNMLDRHSVADGDLLMARAIASQEHLGKCVVAYPGLQKWAFDSHLMRLRFRPSKTEPEFIRNLLMTPGGRQIFLKASRRSAVQFNINTKEIAILRIPLPPVSLQRDFVSRINTLDRLRESHRIAFTQLQRLFASLQHRAFRGEL